MFDLTFLGTSASVPSADRNHPGLLLEAGTHRILQPGQTVETSVTAVPYSGFSAVTAVRPDGVVEGVAR